MKHLYAPWRGSYAKKAHARDHVKNGCPFCVLVASNDDVEYYIIRRSRHVVVFLNAYPYNPGHILIIPTTHHAYLHELDEETRRELMEEISATVATSMHALGCDGMNVGINLGGEAAGGSVPEHLHVHLVPRWKGDTNFMPVIAQTKQLSEDLNEVYKILKKS